MIQERGVCLEKCTPPRNKSKMERFGGFKFSETGSKRLMETHIKWTDKTRPKKTSYL